MLNEILVSTVRYSGQSVGTVSLTVQDTSFYPTYDVSLVNRVNNEITNTNQLQQLNTYDLKFEQIDKNPAITKVYVTVLSLDGKMLTAADIIPTRREEMYLVNLDANGKGSITININYFPSFIGYTGEVSLYHDAERLLLIRTINLNTLPVESGSLEVIPARNVSVNGDLSYYPPYVEMGEDFYVRASFNGPSVITGNSPVRFDGKVSGDNFSSNEWLPVSPDTVLSISKENNNQTNAAKGQLKFSTLINPTNKSQQLISIAMGEIKAFNSLRYPSYIDGFSWINVTVQTVKLYRRLAPSQTDLRCVGICQGSSIGTTAEVRLGPTEIMKASDWDEAYISSYVPNKGANNPTTYKQSYLGEMAAVTWDQALLTTRDSRKQFAKYQKSFVKTVDASAAATTKVSWVDLSDSISNNDYGTPASLSASDLVIVVQPHNRADVCNIQFNTSNLLEFNIRTLVYSATGVQETYNGFVSILAVRKSELLDSYPDWMPYPRIIKADRAVGTALDGEKAWVITIPEGTTIDLTEDRYVVQHTHEQTEVNGGNVTLAWRDNRIKKEKSKITIYGSSTSSNADPKHYIVWDLGPEASFNDATEGRLRGEIRPANISPWVTADLTGPVNADDTKVVVLPTIGDSTQFFQTILISRIVTSEPKKFTLWARDNTSSLYLGKLGLLVWNTKEISNSDRRNQFGRYQKSMLLSYDTNTGPLVIDVNQINNDVATASWGAIADLKDSSLMMFFNTEEYNQTTSVSWDVDKIQIGVNHSQGPNFVGKVSVLFMRVAGWVTYPLTAKYPRVVYADIVDPVNAASFTLPINKTYIQDPLDNRYQILAQTKPKVQNGTWVNTCLAKLVRGNDDWTIHLSGDTTQKLLQIAIIDYGPGSYLFGKSDSVANITDYTFQQPIPNDRLVTDQNYALAPVVSTSSKTGGSSSWWAEGLTRRSVIRQFSNNTLTVRVEGYQDATYGGTRNSARGYVGWDSVRDIGTNLLKQIPNLVGRNSVTVGDGGFGVSSLTNDIDATGKNISNFNDPDLVFVVVPEFGDVRFSFKRLSDGSGIKFINSSTGQPYSLMDGRVNALVLKENKAMPNFAVDAPYPRVIYSAKSVPVTNVDGLVRHLVDLSDPSYVNVNLKNGRYQILFGCEVGDTTGDVFLFMEDESGLVSATVRQWYFYLGTASSVNFGYQARVNVAIIDYGPFVSGEHGDAYTVSTERLNAMLSYYIVASRNAISVINEASKVYGSIRRGWSYFGTFFALFNRITTTNANGGSGFIDLDFTTSDNSILDTTSVKPATIYLSINDGAKLTMNRETSRSSTGSFQRYYVTSNGYSAMFNTMANTQSPAEKTYLVTLT